MAKSSRPRTSLPRLLPRRADAHKASVGRVVVLGGSPGMAGAPALAARGALRAGAGLVTIATPRSVAGVVAGFLAETMTAGLAEEPAGGLGGGADADLAPFLDKADVLVVGPGLGRLSSTAEFVRRLLAKATLPVVVDADALHAMRGRLRDLAKRDAVTIVTPHEGEAHALDPVPADESRLARASRLAKAARAICILKGPKTVVSDGTRTYVNDTGGPVLATGGTGDVLSGVVAALLAGAPGNGLDPFGAACLAVHAHGAAGDSLAARRGDRGVLSHEIADAIPDVLRTFAKRGARR